MHVDNDPHGQDDEFTAEFDKRLNGAPSDQDREASGEKDGDDQAGADEAPAEQPGADKAPEQEVKDPWAGASPELIAERDRLRGELDRAKHSDQSQRGRVSALTREITQLRSTVTPPHSPQGDGKEGGDKDEDPEAKTKAERLKNLREDYPDLAGPILDLIDEARNEVKALGGRVSPVIDANNEAAIEAQEIVLAEKHPDWRDVGASQDFAGWAETQSKQIQALCSSFDAAEVSAALTLFKTARDASKAKEPDPKPGDDPKPQEQQRDDRRDRQLQGARDRPSRAAPAAAGAPDDFEGAFSFFAQRRERQKK